MAAKENTRMCLQEASVLDLTNIIMSEEGHKLLLGVGIIAILYFLVHVFDLIVRL